MRNMVIGLSNIQTNCDGICKGYVQGKNIKSIFLVSDRKEKGILDIVHSDVCRPNSLTSLSR